MITHPHAGEQARLLAEAGTVLRTRIGGVVHGTSSEGTGDRDELGLCLEPEEFVTGAARVLTPGGRSIPFERYEVHTAWTRSRGHRERSGPGDLDLVIHTARRWAVMAAAGNPSVLLPLWVPPEHVVVLTPAGRDLRANADRFVSRTGGRACLGYLRSQWEAAQRRTVQRQAARGRGGRGPAGYAARPAAHAVRAGLQGLDLLRTGTLHLPVPAPDLAVLREVRAGTLPLREVTDLVRTLEADLDRESRTADVPAGTDLAWLRAWSTRSHEEFWAAARG